MRTSGRSGVKRPRPKRQSSTPQGRRTAEITIIVEEKLWRMEPHAIALLHRAARVALQTGAGKKRHSRALAILLADDTCLKELNALFRGQSKKTNVLSFPSSETRYLGDVAIAHGVVAREARTQGKSFAAHASHLAAHGVLHLLGYDHENARDAKIMEKLETEILARLGLPDPYGANHKAA